MLSDDRILKNHERGAHIALTCRNHPNLRWTTKNIGFIGARSIFFAGSVEEGKRRDGFNVADPFTTIKRWLDEGIIKDFEDLRATVQSYKEMMDEGVVYECVCPGSDLIPAPEALKEEVRT